MSLEQEVSASPAFEIDNPEEFGQFVLSSRREIVFYLLLLAKRRCIVTAYLDDGQQFFLSSVLAADEEENQVCLDPSSEHDNNLLAQSAGKITLTTNLDRVKMQMRLPSLKMRKYQGQDVLWAPLPAGILRLQRREFFRLEPPLSAPILCKLAILKKDGDYHFLELVLSDISGGGVSLIGSPEMARYFPRDALFTDCRLEIPGEGIIQINLLVRKTIEISARNGEHGLRIGCEFVNLPGSRLAFIERYITRIERERKAWDPKQ